MNTNGRYVLETYEPRRGWEDTESFDDMGRGLAACRKIAAEGGKVKLWDTGREPNLLLDWEGNMTGMQLLLTRLVQNQGYDVEVGRATMPPDGELWVGKRLGGHDWTTYIRVVFMLDDEAVDVYEFEGNMLLSNHTRFDRVDFRNVTKVEWFIRTLEE